MSVPNSTSFTRASTTRYMSTHATCSAFSSSANPDEDWTTVLDLAERRRIQNRIAQRNYRRKLKRRLEDLERRAGPASVSPSQMHVEVQQPYCTSEKLQLETSPDFEHQRQASPRTLPSHYTHSVDDHEKMLSRDFDRNESRMPPLVAYNTYVVPKEVLYRPHPDSPSQSYRTTVTRGEYENYITPIPVIPPSTIHFQEAIKREGDDNMNPYNIYDNSSFPAIDLHSHHYEDPKLQVSRSFSPVATSTSASSLAAAGPFRTSRNNMFEQTPALSYCYDQMVYYSKSYGYQYPPTQ